MAAPVYLKLNGHPEILSILFFSNNLLQATKQQTIRSLQDLRRKQSAGIGLSNSQEYHLAGGGNSEGREIQQTAAGFQLRVLCRTSVDKWDEVTRSVQLLLIFRH